MAKQRKVIGSGITARAVESYSGDDMAPAFVAFAKQWNAALTEANGSAFHAVVLDTERACRRILAAPDAGPHEADNFAARILRAIETTRSHVARGDADAAARAAIEIGTLCTEARIKGLWETHALRGEKLATRLKANTARKNTTAKAEAARRYASWQAMADRAWAQNKYLSAADIGWLIARELGGDADTIRRNAGTIRRKITRK